MREAATIQTKKRHHPAQKGAGMIGLEKLFTKLSMQYWELLKQKLMEEAIVDLLDLIGRIAKAEEQIEHVHHLTPVEFKGFVANLQSGIYGQIEQQYEVWTTLEFGGDKAIYLDSIYNHNRIIIKQVKKAKQIQHVHRIHQNSYHDRNTIRATIGYF